MHCLKNVLSLVVLLFGAACSAVVVDSPMGQTALAVDPAEWDGEWLGIAADSDERVIGTVEVVDAANGILQATWIEDGELQRTPIHLRQAGDWVFASVPYLDDFGSDGEIPQGVPYVWARIVKNENHIFIWYPNVSRFRERIAEGQLPGELRDGKGDAFLGALDAEHYALVASESAASLFEWDAPGVLVRVGP